MHKLGVLLVVFMLAPFALAEDSGASSETAPSAGQSVSDEGGGGNQTAKENATADQNATSDDELSDSNSDAEATGKTSRPCRLYTYEGFQPQPSLYPLLGIITLDPDRCYQHSSLVPGWA